MARLSNTTVFEETDRDGDRIKMDPADEAKLAANIELPPSPAKELNISDIIVDERDRRPLRQQGKEAVDGDDGKGSKTMSDTSTIKAASANAKASTLSLVCISSAFIVGYIFDVALLQWLFLIMSAVFLLLPAESVEELVHPGRSGGEEIRFRGKANSGTTALEFGEKIKDLIVGVYDYGVNKIFESAGGEDETGMDQVDRDDGETYEEQEDAGKAHDE